MLQNRVDPWGNIVRTNARGAWMGNRGLLHNERREIVRPFRLKAWLICVLEFKGRRRSVMTPGQYTELFFLDEATAFSAGHRPCFECRREDAKRFRSCWVKGNPEYGFSEKTPIAAIDEVLHRERIGHDGSKISYSADVRELPDGCFVAFDGQAYLVSGGALYPWSPFGYGERLTLTGAERFTVLTPRSVVRAFHAGYKPQRVII